MKYLFAFFVCVLSLTVFYSDTLSADCGCGKKKPIGPPPPEMLAGGGCSCEDGNGSESDDLPIVPV